MINDPSVSGYAAALAPFIAILSAFVTPLLSSLFKRPQRFAFIFSEIILILNMFLTLVTAYYVFITRDIIIYMFAAFPPPFGIVYEIDLLNAFIGILIGIIFPIVNITAYNYLENVTKHNEWYYTIFLGLEAGLLGIAYTGDLFNLFVMLEVASITAYGLTAYLRERGRPLNAAIKYGLIGAVGSTIYFLAVVLLYSGLGTLNMADVASKALGLELFHTMGTAIDVGNVLILFTALAVWAFMIEAAIFPHHFWLPDAYSSMPPVAAATMAAVAEGVSVYVIIRLIYTVVGIEYSSWILYLLLFLGSLNIVVGGYLMAVSKDMKRLIAYSTVLDMGYVVIGIGLGSAIGLAATLYYIFCHAIVKPLLFISVGAIESLTGTTYMDKVTGIAKSEPLIGIGLLIGGLAIIGIPPLNIFFAKLMLFQAVLENKMYPLIIILALGSVFAFIGFTRLLYSVYGVRTKGIEFQFKITIETKTVIMLLVVATILSGLFFIYLKNELLDPISMYILSENGRISYIEKAYDLFKLVYSR